MKLTPRDHGVAIRAEWAVGRDGGGSHQGGCGAAFDIGGDGVLLARFAAIEHVVGRGHIELRLAVAAIANLCGHGACFALGAAEARWAAWAWLHGECGVTDGAVELSHTNHYNTVTVTCAHVRRYPYGGVVCGWVVLN